MRRLQNEVQMLLYTHPLNDRREAAGLLPVNSLLAQRLRPPARWRRRRGRPQVDDRLRQPALAEDWAAWCDAWRALDAGPIDALARAGASPCNSPCAANAWRRPSRPRPRACGSAWPAAGSSHRPPPCWRRCDPCDALRPTLQTRDVPPRVAFALEQAGVHPLLARLFAARGVRSADDLDDGLARLLPPSQLHGAEAPRVLLADAIAAAGASASWPTTTATAPPPAPWPCAAWRCWAPHPARCTTWCPTAWCTATA
jgi:hypothetical protein